ncbi:uracil-DNA glycosylase family protein [Thalassospiraceae bacterium LMO-JJ14]|nr:uracil-DNA glycosylase family protein [Thalassospiraceae bacterium LMO-JJ14]
MTQPAENLDTLLTRVRACDICRDHLPLGPRPVVRISETAKILIIGQAPGTKVHETGVPWDDPSGERLRGWLALDVDRFYDTSKIAIMPTGFCYPGRDPKGGDLPPRPECAPAWHGPLRKHLKAVQLTLLVGMHAQAFCLGDKRKRTMTETVRAWREYAPDVLPMPHPSWRTTAWARKNPWFEEELVPEIRRRVKVLIF